MNQNMTNRVGSLRILNLKGTTEKKQTPRKTLLELREGPRNPLPKGSKWEARGPTKSQESNIKTHLP